MNKNQVQFTFHSLTRASELGVSVRELIESWKRSTGYELPKKEFGWKFWKYGLEMADDIYLYDSQSELLFTCVKKEGFSLIVTITKRKDYHATHSK